MLETKQGERNLRKGEAPFFRSPREAIPLSRKVLAL